jgi:hypothetical protein
MRNIIYQTREMVLQVGLSVHQTREMMQQTCKTALQRLAAGFAAGKIISTHCNTTATVSPALPLT